MRDRHLKFHEERDNLQYPGLERCYEQTIASFNDLIDSRWSFTPPTSPTWKPPSHRCWYRVKCVRRTFRHVGTIASTVAKAFDEHIPFEDRGASAEQVMSSALGSEFGYRMRRRSGPPPVFHAVPTARLFTMLWRLALSQTPHHDPANQPLPDWVATWMREYDRGTDMTTFFGRG